MKVIILICVLFGVAYAQNCGITDEDGDTVLMPAVLETTAAAVKIWEAPTFNVVSAASIQHPHTRYLSGLRYSTRYEYHSTDVFPEFVQTERAAELLRTVLFTCADGGTRTYNFVLPVTDENTEAPIFESKTYSAIVSLSDNTTEPTTANVFVSDSDYEHSNANLIIRSSNARVTPFVQPQWVGSYPATYQYKVDFLINRETLEAGSYDVIITADDGKHSDFTVLTLVVVA